MEQQIIIGQRLQLLRQQMKQENMQAYYIPTDDFHGSEYVSDYFKSREYISGFTGSAGVLVVLKDFAGLWTDGRYFLQAEEQLQGTEIVLMKMGEPNVPTIEEFLAEHLQSGDTLGFDGRCVNGAFLKELKTAFGEKEIRLEGSVDLVGRIWENRPSLTFHPVWEMELSQSGVSRQDKISRLREKMKELGADAHLLTSLEDIAWLLNLRGSDIYCNPVFLAYLYITKKDCILFAGDIIALPIREKLKQDGVQVEPYDAVYSFVANDKREDVLQKEANLQQEETSLITIKERMGFKKDALLINENIVNSRLLEVFSQQFHLQHQENPTAMMKAVKNPVELANIREAHIRDGVAVTRFIHYMKKYARLVREGKWDKEPLTELSAAEILFTFRKDQPGFLGNSFEPIMAYGTHGAIVHYSASDESNAVIGTDSFLLSDTGGHYQIGTTDITRTISLAGESLTPEQKRHYTLVLKANLRLMAAKFPKGVTGNSLDAIAREPLWKEGLDFNHGTGHGVGYLLSVHEGPNAIRTYRGRGIPDATAVVPGMITSDEPGLYFANQYGIRLENLIECVEEENGFYGFRPLTFVPFDREAIDKDLLNNDEKDILNSYYGEICDKISMYLNAEEKAWLEKEIQPIS